MIFFHKTAAFTQTISGFGEMGGGHRVRIKLRINVTCCCCLGFTCCQWRQQCCIAEQTVVLRDQRQIGIPQFSDFLADCYTQVKNTSCSRIHMEIFSFAIMSEIVRSSWLAQRAQINQICHRKFDWGSLDDSTITPQCQRKAVKPTPQPKGGPFRPHPFVLNLHVPIVIQTTAFSRMKMLRRRILAFLGHSIDSNQAFALQ